MAGGIHGMFARGFNTDGTEGLYARGFGVAASGGGSSGAAAQAHTRQSGLLYGVVRGFRSIIIILLGAL